jgi:rhodanese-related sulfurtransferase
MNIKSSKELVDQANESIKIMSPEQVKKAYDKSEVTLIDVRDIRELWKEGTIKDSIHIPRGMLEFWLDPQSSYYQEKKIGDIKNIVLFCALGFRSALATKALKEMGFDNVANANGGFDSLKKIGLPVIAKEKK